MKTFLEQLEQLEQLEHRTLILLLLQGFVWQ